MTAQDDARPARYLGQAAIARRMDVSKSAVAVWRSRYGPASSHPFPEPDALTGDDDGDGIPGWRPERIGEIRAWREGLPGQGAGGGRPRRDA